jgi:hypothetical protein
MGESSGAQDANVSDAADRVKESAHKVVETTKSAAQDTLSEDAAQVSDTAHAAAQSLRHAADEVQSEHAWIGTTLRKSADCIENATRSLQGGDINRALSDLNGFARRQPTLFLGGSLALGFVLARVGKTALKNAVDSANDGTRQTGRPAWTSPEGT